MNFYFLDSSYLIALEAKDDQYHQKAQEHWESLFTVPSTLVTSSYIFDEVVAFFNSRGHHSKAVQVGESLLKSSYITFIHVDQELFNEGWDYFKKHSDKTYSLTDCISFLNMAAQQQPSKLPGIIQRLLNWIQKIKSSVDKIVRGIGGNGYSIGVSAPFGVSVSISFPI